MTTRIRDLITLPDVRTVVQLSDVYDPSLRDGLKEGFVLTEDVYTNLTILLEQIASGNGVGVFIEGSYGSGKSHFLTIISLLLSHQDVWEDLIEKRRELADHFIHLKDKRFVVLNTSLVSHGSREGLEEIIYSYLNEAVPGVITRGETASGEENLSFDISMGRKENFEILSRLLHGSGIDGVVVLMDELSEFLRSKPDGRAFNEDIRFLQFLGEYSQREPVWIIASLQERLEEIGAINEDSFNKIKDRYRIRLFLSAEHIEELIKKRLIIKRDGAMEEIEGIYEVLRGAFSQLDISKERFCELYPVHPYTLGFLDELKSLFSQRRGVVDFIHYQIRGDNTRRIQGIMDMPKDSLLGPEYIFDHFLVRMQETARTRRYYQVVYGYLSKELGSIFPEPDMRAIALRLVKILLLKAFSPYEKKRGLSIREMAEMILYRVTSIDSQTNYRFLSDIMERLYTEGSYIGYHKGAHFYEDIYYIDIKEDIQGIIRQRSEYIRQGLLPDDERIFDLLSEWMDINTLPLSRLKGEERIKEFVRWQYTTREGFISVRSLEEIGIDEIDGLLEEYRRGETDFFLFIDRLSKGSRERFFQEVLPYLRESGIFLPFIFWLPRYPEDERELRDGLVYYLLLERYREDTTDTGKRIFNYLYSSLKERKRRILEIFTDAYFSGELIYLNREGRRHLNEIGILPFDKLLQRIVFTCLNHLYPRHRDIAPLSDYFVPDTLQRVIDRFFREGEIVFDPGIDRGIEMMIQGQLYPLKVIKRIPHGYRLSVDPGQSRIVSIYLKEIEEGGGRIALERLYLSLRKGEYGISRNQFEMLTLAMLFSGHVRGFSGRKEIGINRSNAISNIWAGIEEIGEGELIEPSLRELLVRLPIISEKIKREGFSYVTQQRAWDELIGAKRLWMADEEGLFQTIRRLAGYRSLSHIDMQRIEEEFTRVRRLFHEIKVSYPAKKGLEHLLRYYTSDPFIGEVYERVIGFKRFVSSGDMDIYTSISSYINDPSMVIPDGERYSSLIGMRDDVRDRLIEGDGIFKEDYIQELSRLFNRFRETYILMYQEEHRRLRSVERFSPYLRIKDSPGYRLLARLSGIEMISVEDDLVRVNRYIAGVEEMICRGVDQEELKVRPVCRCGLRLGDEVMPMPIREMEKTIERGIVEYINCLKESRYRERIESYVVNLEDIGKERNAEEMRRILDLETDKRDDMSMLQRHVTERLITRLNEAFAGRVMIIDRDINELLENIVDRNFPKERLISIFREWLNRGVDLDEDVYIRVRYKGYGRDEGKAMEDIVGQIFPELLVFVREVGDKIFRRLVLASVWASFHDIPSEEVYRVLEIGDPSRYMDDLEERCRRIFEYMVGQKARGILHDIEEIERGICGDGIDMGLLDLVVTKRGGEDGLVDELFKESIFTFVAKGILSILIKRLYTEREVSGIRRIKRLTGEWLSRGEEINGQEHIHHILRERMEKRRYVKVLHNLTHILLAMEWLEGVDLSGFDAEMWERAFIEHGAGIEIRTDALIKEIEEIGIGENISLKEVKREKERFISTFDKGFSGYVMREYKRMVIGAQERGKEKRGSPLFINAIRFYLYERYKKRLNPVETHLLLIDGMRWDIWEYCRDDIMARLRGGYRIVDEIPVWSFLPSTTSYQLQPIMTGELPKGYGDIIDRDIASATAAEEKGYYSKARGGDIAQFKDIMHESDLHIYRYSLIDDKIHTSMEDMPTIYEEIRLNIQSALGLYMERLPVRSMVIIFSDHGFIRKPGQKKRREAKTSQYSHGGRSPWEMIVPVIVLYRWM